MRRLLSSIGLLLAVLAMAAPARAHVGSKDVFEQVNAGPYKLFVTIRPPTVIPGVAAIEVRSSGGAAIDSLEVTPVPITGEASRHPPAADVMKRSDADPAFFTGSLWLMSSGSWEVRFHVRGAAGEATTNIPVPAIPLSTLKMQRGLGTVLAVLGVILALGMAGIVAAAVREARLTPGEAPDPVRRRRATLATGAALALIALALWGGATWWNVEAASYSDNVYRPLTVTPHLVGNQLDLAIASFRQARDVKGWHARSNADFLPDHGHLMHLYAIREPGMDAVFHLHPALAAPGDFRMDLPAMPPGEYKLYGDVVHANGFPETLTASLHVPEGMPGGRLDAEDASAAPPPVGAAELGVAFRLPDGYTMTWDRPSTISASTAYAFRFHLLDGNGRPAPDMRPYLGMAGHAAFVKTDGSTFAHTHPEGSAAMQAIMLANGDSMGEMNSPSSLRAPGTAGSEAIAPTVEFPYGFPSPGRYRIFVQMKHGDTVETGVFDATVQ